MHKLTLVAFGAAALLATPAFAQSATSPSSGTSSSSGATSSDNSGSHGQMSSQSSTSSHNTAQMRQKLAQSLRQDGFTDVHVIADSFLVHAKNKQGQPVVMIINPDSVFSVTKVHSAGHSKSPSQ